MKKLLALIVPVLVISCGEGNKNKKEDVVFFQVKQFVQKELEDIKTTPYFIYKIEIRDSARDSSVISIDTLVHYSQTFTEPDINDKELKGRYR